jgi:hypothetical protein
VKIECESCHEVFESEAPKEYGERGGGVVQMLVCTECGHEKPLARITYNGVKMRDQMTRLRNKGKPVPEELVESYHVEFTPLLEPNAGKP